jgi:adenine-specific DNA-methyltransferase
MRRTIIRKSSGAKMMGDGVRLWWEGRREPAPLPLTPLVFDHPSPESSDAAGDERGGSPAWRNILVHADNLVVLGQLTRGSMAAPLRALGGVALIYIDPPYAMETDFHVGDGESAGLAFRDSWGTPGVYLQFMYDRLVPMRTLLRDDGVLCLHCDWRANSWLRVLLDEVFGRACFRNEIIWRRAPNLGNQAAAKQLGRVADSILVYSKTPGSIFRGKPPMRSQAVELTKTGRPRGAKWDEDRKEWFTTAPRGDYTDASIRQLRRDGRVYDSPSGKVYIKYPLRHGEDGLWYKDQPVDTLWTDEAVKPLRHCSREELDVGYPTQKPLGLLRRIVEWTTREGDVVGDFFCGSGTTLLAAEFLGRQWIGCDVGGRAVEVAAGRLAGSSSLVRYRAGAEPGAEVGPERRAVAAG